MLTKMATLFKQVHLQCRGGLYFGIFLGCAVLSGVILIPLRRRVRRPVTAISVILRTPFSFFRVVPSSWTVIEIPSFYRGLVALWVIFWCDCHHSLSI